MECEVYHPFGLENQLESELHLARRISASGPRQICGPLKVRWKVFDSNSLIELNEIRGSADKAVLRDGDT
jgi:hypothetical protein